MSEPLAATQNVLLKSREWSSTITCLTVVSAGGGYAGLKRRRPLNRSWCLLGGMWAPDNEVRAPPLYRPLKSSSIPSLMTPIKEEPRLPQPPQLLPSSVTFSIIYFRRWATLSAASITGTLISPLEEEHQYTEWNNPQKKTRRREEEGTPWLPAVWIRRASLGAFSSFSE